jgi:hypothetical protein
MTVIDTNLSAVCQYLGTLNRTTVTKDPIQSFLSNGKYLINGTRHYIGISPSGDTVCIQFHDGTHIYMCIILDMMYQQILLRTPDSEEQHMEVVDSATWLAGDFWTEESYFQTSLLRDLKLEFYDNNALYRFIDYISDEYQIEKQKKMSTQTFRVTV